MSPSPAPSTRRRRPVASTALSLGLTLGLSLGLLTACGEESTSRTDGAGDPSPTVQPTDQPSSTTSGPREDGPVEHLKLSINTGTNVGGAVEAAPTRLDSDAAVDTWVSQFEDEAFQDDLRAVVEGAPGLTAGETPMGAVLHIGCEVPRDYDVVRVDGELRLEVVVPKKKVQCFAPMTTTAIFAVDASELS